MRDHHPEEAMKPLGTLLVLLMSVGMCRGQIQPKEKAPTLANIVALWSDKDFLTSEISDERSQPEQLVGRSQERRATHE